jgi:DNA-binding transcriptional regulator/RsmH inhibitor MraZ
LGGKGNYFNHKKYQEDLDPKGKVTSPTNFREFGDMERFGCIMGCTTLDHAIAKWVS